eukprot:9670783-Alexandrium_andersonii.AAC.1
MGRKAAAGAPLLEPGGGAAAMTTTTAGKINAEVMADVQEARRAILEKWPSIMKDAPLEINAGAGRKALSSKGHKPSGHKATQRGHQPGSFRRFSPSRPPSPGRTTSFCPTRLGNNAHTVLLELPCAEP